MRTNSNRRALAVLILVLALASFEVLAKSAGSSSSVDNLERLTDLVVEVVPIGASMESMMQRNDYWPLKSPPSDKNVASIGCIREKLSAADYRNFVRQQVDRYAAAFPDRIESDVKVLSGEGGKILQSLFLENGENNIPIEGFDIDGFTSRLTKKQNKLAHDLLLDDSYYPLRSLLGLRNGLYKTAIPSQLYDKNYDLIVKIRSAYLMDRVNQCPFAMENSFVQPSLRYPDDPMPMIITTTTEPPSKSVRPPVMFVSHRPERVFSTQCKRSKSESQEIGLIKPSIRIPRSDPAHPPTTAVIPHNLLVPGTKLKVRLHVYVTETGEVERAVLIESSGIPAIDDIALSAPATWQLLPGLVDNIPTCMWIATPITF